MPVWREEMAKKKVGAYITLDGEKEACRSGNGGKCKLG